MSDLGVEELMLKPYPAYKDSGVEWLGVVPEHWEIARLKSVAMNVVRQTTERRDDEMYIALEHVEGWTGRIRQADVDVAFESQVKRFQAGDILFGKLRPYLAKVTLPPSDGVCVGEFLVLRPRNASAVAPYMGHLLRSKPVIDAISGSTFGAKMPRADWGFIGAMLITLPPLPEQTAIVRYLDYIDRRIRRYIRAKQKLIKLLEEQKQVIIHEAVTGQIDVRTGKPYPAYKDSGVEWLGQIPEHWKVLPLKRVAWFKSGAGFPTSEQGRPNSEIPFLRVSDMTRPGNERWIEVVDSTVTMQTARRLGAFVFPENAVIFPKVGGALLTNKRRLLRRASCIDNNLMGCVVRHADVQFMFTVLQQLDLGRLAKPGPVPAIGEGDVRGIRVAIPPSAEQTAIVRYLDDATANAEAAIAHARREIELLREYRTRLIADVATGKLDVREAAANLPDEAEEPELLAEEGLLTDENEADETVEDEADLEEVEA